MALAHCAMNYLALIRSCIGPKQDIVGMITATSGKGWNDRQKTRTDYNTTLAEPPFSGLHL